MKNLKLINVVMLLVLTSLFVGITFSGFIDVSPYVIALTVAVATIVVAFIASLLKASDKFQSGFAYMAVALNQLVIAELTRRFEQLNEDFLAKIKDYSGNVNNDVIKFNEIGADPNVLIDNTVYPIAVNIRDDDSHPVSLRKLETENTAITDDELIALPYDKKSNVMDRHVKALLRARIKLATYSLAPAADDANTPVLLTTGATVGTRKRLQIADLVAFRERLVALEIDPATWNLVLNPDHVGDLLLIDQAFRDRFYSTESGKVMKNIYGFDMFENILMPGYNGNAKKAFGAAPAVGDQSASVFFSDLNAMKATGSVKMYMRQAELDPENRQTVIGFRVRAIVNPVTVKGVGAIISDLA